MEKQLHVAKTEMQKSDAELLSNESVKQSPQVVSEIVVSVSMKQVT